MRFLVLAVILVQVFCLASVQGQNEPGAIWMPSPNRVEGRGGNTVKWLILHGTAGGASAEDIGHYFQNPASEVSTHYVVGQDGSVVQCVNEADTAWGNGRVEAGADSWWGTPNPNQVTISIEHVKSLTDNSNEITAAQKTASWRLISNILARNPGIRPYFANSNGGLTGHFSMSPGSRDRCPGPFPWEDLFTHLNGQSAPVCIGSVTADSLNIRLQPNSQTSIVGSLPNGRVINIRSKVVGEVVGGNKWWFLLGDNSGYVSALYVRVHINQPAWCSSQ